MFWNGKKRKHRCEPNHPFLAQGRDRTTEAVG
jgi:hypothetical protein